MHMMGFDDTEMYSAVHMYFFQIAQYQGTDELLQGMFLGDLHQQSQKHPEQKQNSFVECPWSKHDQIRNGQEFSSKLQCTSSLKDKATSALRLSLEIFNVKMRTIFVPGDTYCFSMLWVKVQDKRCVGDLQFGAEHLEAGLLSSCNTCVYPSTLVEFLLQKMRIYTSLR